MEVVVLPDYKVNPKTMALVAVFHIDYSTIVYEKDQKLYVRKTPTEIVKDSCLDGGSTYDGRRLAVMYHTDSKRKVPIPIIPDLDIYAFPTKCPGDSDCSWIFFHHIKYISTFSCKKNPFTKSIVTFNNGEHITLTESNHSMQKQMQRTAMCVHRFKKM